ncbi:hypothetical protein RQP46_011074 [Phenoliferia psychrophenolica]
MDDHQGTGSPGSSTGAGGVEQPTKKRGAPDFKLSIKRGSACLACRSKKLKCDGVRPVCGKCTKSRRSHGGSRVESAAAFPCAFEDLPEGEKRRRVSSKQVDALEAKLAALQKRSDELQAISEASELPPMDYQSLPLPPFPPPSHLPSHLDVDFAQSFSFPSIDPSLNPDFPSPSTSSISSYQQSTLFSHATSHSHTQSSAASSSATSPSSFDLASSSYPLDLPPLPVMRRIASSFISSIHPGAFQFQPSFNRRLALEPSDSKFPSAALLYALTGVSVEFFGVAVLELEGESDCFRRSMGLGWDGTGSPALWFIERARDRVRTAIVKSSKLYDAGQALNLICHYAHRICQYTDIWTLSGGTVRMSVLMGLNHPEKPSICLPPPADAEDEQNRRLYFWWTVVGNHFASANTGWATSIQLEDITTLLPSLTFPTEDRETEWRALSLWSPEFYSFHPEQHVGGLQLFFKSMILLGRSVMQPARCPIFGHPVAIPKREVTPQDIRNDSGFVALSSDIDAFVLSTSSFPTDEPSSPFLLLLQSVPQVCKILIHEPLCTSEINDWSMMISLESARRVLTTVSCADAEGASSFEWLPWIVLCWSIAARTFVRALAVKEAWGDTYGAPELRANIEFIISAIESYHTLHSAICVGETGLPDVRLTMLVNLLPLIVLAATCASTRAAPLVNAATSNVAWSPCGDGFDCTRISAPLDWRNASDPRTVSLAVGRYNATQEPYLGVIWYNPGGPGGSGSAQIYSAGPALSLVTNGQYDIISWDPRGVNASSPNLTCFNNELDHGNISVLSAAGVEAEFEEQLARKKSSLAALWQQCVALSGDIAAFMGTESVVRDLDHMSKMVSGPEVRINYFAVSYGSLLGQYLVAILPPSRLGLVVIDGIANADVWQDYPTRQITTPSYADVDSTIRYGFAQNCAVAGDLCPLSSLGSADDIILAINTLIDQMYFSPVTISLSSYPSGSVKPEYARALLYATSQSPSEWATAAVAFAEALNGNFSVLIDLIAPSAIPDLVSLASQSATYPYSTEAVMCADWKAYTASHPPPTTKETARLIRDNLEHVSGVMGESLYLLTFCDLWPSESKSRYEGSLKLSANALATPVLILTNTWDPVTPKLGALTALQNIGITNARLVEQNGTGHTTFETPTSPCVTDIVSPYFQTLF